MAYQNETAEIIKLVDGIKKDILKTRIKILTDANKELFVYILESER